MKLFSIQDHDRPMMVLEEDWKSALNRWKQNIAAENDIPLDDVEDPDGIMMVAESEDIILPDTVFPVFRDEPQ